MDKNRPFPLKGNTATRKTRCIFRFSGRFISYLHGDSPGSAVFLKKIQKKSTPLNPVQHCLMNEIGKPFGHLFSKKSKKYFGMNPSTPIFAIRF
jgi:hypothetical protein